MPRGQLSLRLHDPSTGRLLVLHDLLGEWIVLGSCETLAVHRHVHHSHLHRHSHALLSHHPSAATTLPHSSTHCSHAHALGTHSATPHATGTLSERHGR
jgi:hypothetical protein